MLTAKQEALARLQKLEESLPNVNPNIRKYFEEGKLYYSYLTGGGFIGSIDTITYNPNYEQAVREFEQSKDKLVYHVIETGNSLTFLYVTLSTDEWEEEELAYEWDEERLSKDNSLLAYICNLENPSYSEFGYIGIDTFMDSGALIRIF